MPTFFEHVRGSFESEYAGKKSPFYDFKAIYMERLIEFRKPAESIVRVERPTNLPRARALGYKAKKGFVVARVRVRKGSGMHHRPSRARRPKRMGVKKLTRRISIQGIAEKRANKKYPNCEVLNSYWVGEDGRNKYFEVIMVDPQRPEIQGDKNLRWLASSKHNNRAERGKTSAQRKSRGLKRGKGHEKNFPSLRAHDRKAK
ncbi:MAG: 50S ribosomal protein L15e [Candidatus Diapherotrites archaeon]|nr:50S ribosomal protein L15e [Candidatus Diapherotrites archaeon]